MINAIVRVFCAVALVAGCALSISQDDVQAVRYSCTKAGCPEAAFCDGDLKDTNGCSVTCYNAASDGELSEAGEANCADGGLEAEG